VTCSRATTCRTTRGCSAARPKSLSRATQELTGLGAQQYLARRRALEAQRLLAHTSLPVAQVADRLGFDEATNFVKFFRREAGCTPTEFRRTQGGPAQEG
jgi:AraC-like DNA-binding protein